VPIQFFSHKTEHTILSLKYLLISAPPRVKIPKSYEEGVILEIGEVIRLKATFSGRPIPIVHWLHNGEEVKIATQMTCKIHISPKDINLAIYSMILIPTIEISSFKTTNGPKSQPQTAPRR
jgi:hypothetical protein